MIGATLRSNRNRDADARCYVDDALDDRWRRMARRSLGTTGACASIRARWGSDQCLDGARARSRSLCGITPAAVRCTVVVLDCWQCAAWLIWLVISRGVARGDQFDWSTGNTRALGQARSES